MALAGHPRPCETRLYALNCPFHTLTHALPVFLQVIRFATCNGLVCITSWYTKFNGSHFGLPPSSIHRKGRFCKPNFGYFFGKVRVRFRPGRVGVLPKKSNRIFCSANRIFFFVRFDRSRKVCWRLAPSQCPSRLPRSWTFAYYSTITWPIAIANREDLKLNVLFKDSDLNQTAPDHKHKSQTRESNASKDGPMVVYPANNRLFGLAVNNRLSLSLLLSFSSPSFFPCFFLQTSKTKK